MNRDHLLYLGALERRRELSEEAQELERFIREYEKRTGSKHLRNVHAGKGGNTGPWAKARKEQRQQTRKARKSTRRRGMSSEQRQAVSERMRKYWAERRASKGAKKR
jgi:hypothetical protein